MNANRSIRDVVVPLISGKWTANDFAYEKLEGTMFLIGRRGFAVTAAHVVDQFKGDLKIAAGAFVDNTGAWTPIEIAAVECHDTEDVAILQLKGVLRSSWLAISPAPEYQACEYDAWGYPIAVAKHAAKYEEAGLERPDLVFTRGYVRRRLSRELPSSIYRGAAFYELSEQAGHGCSGGPVISRKSLGQPLWNVIGIYIGECDGAFAAGYAVRTDALQAWQPKLVGQSIELESRNV